jgi:hypothetical protein
MVERLQRAVLQNLVVPKIEYKMDKIIDHPRIKRGKTKKQKGRNHLMLQEQSKYANINKHALKLCGLNEYRSYLAS